MKQFTGRDELNEFVAQLQKRAIEMIFEGELDGHLGYNKHEPSSNSNSRNGYGRKKIKTSYGKSEINVPRDRDASFNRTGNTAYYVPHSRRYRPRAKSAVGACIPNLLAAVAAGWDCL